MDDADDEVREVYHRVVRIANYFLDNGSNLSFKDLMEFDPSLEQMAKDLRLLASVIREIAGESYTDNNLVINAHQCSILMERIALSVETDDRAQFDELVSTLDTHANSGVC